MDYIYNVINIKYDILYTMYNILYSTNITQPAIYLIVSKHQSTIPYSYTVTIGHGMFKRNLGQVICSRTILKLSSKLYQ